MRRPRLRIAVVSLMILVIYGCFSTLDFFEAIPFQRPANTGLIAYWFKESEESGAGNVPAEVSIQPHLVRDKFKAFLVYPTYSDCKGKFKSPDFAYLLDFEYSEYPDDMAEWETEIEKWQDE